LVFFQLGEQCGLFLHQVLPGFGGQLGFRLQSPVSPNVEQFMATFSQYASYQQPAMAVRRILFTAEQCHTIIGNSPLQPINARLKVRVRSHAAV